jgi:hypothetical protein
MKLFDIVFAKLGKLDSKCEYIPRCAAYQDDSSTCTKSPNGYCGIYRQFEEQTIEIYTGNSGDDSFIM